MTMERKRKLRASARSEHVAKKRTATPEKSLTPAPEPAPEPIIAEEPPLPKSLPTAGNPLPVVENPQRDDLSNKEYQTVQESGVLAESLIRSRQKWINEGIFEKYWTKPTKRKGVVIESPDNPKKESMQKIGTITITVEPHILEATMYAVKDPKPTAPKTNSTFRPIMQYGPPNGVMPPPPKPATPVTPATPSTPQAVQSSPTPVPSQLHTPALPTPQLATQLQTRAPTHSQTQPQLPHSEPQRPPSATATPNRAPLASPRGLDSVLAAPGAPKLSHAPQDLQATQPPLRSPALPTAQPHPAPALSTALAQPGIPQSRPLHASSSTMASTPATTGVVNPLKPPTPTAKPATPTAPGADPIIVTLAERASEDPELRDLMKRVAVGDAAQPELAHFQRIIDQITAEYKKKGGQQGPSADRLIVDGRTVKYFADEVRAILDIVLASNPNQKGADLRPPHGADPLVILLVKKSLDDPKAKEMVRRVAEGKTKFDDATRLKGVLDKLKDLVTKEVPKPIPSESGLAKSPAAQIPASAANGAPARKTSVTSAGPLKAHPASSQALRSKGPPPALKSDISAIVLEFSGGTGDRYLFPKYSILEYQPSASQLLASFLIVRKGSKSEYGGDPALDYYQPITIRLSSHSGKYLENLARVVAPQDEVRRYMDDIMDNMTRAEYILLAMRLPRPDQQRDEMMDDRSETPKSDHMQQPHIQSQKDVLWKTAAAARLEAQPAGNVLGEDEQYQSFVATVS